MPQFPTSKYSASPAAGTFVRAQGSHSPMVEAEVGIPDFIQHPFRITARVEAGVAYAKVRAGTVNNLIPVIDGTPLNEVPAPELTMTNGSINKIYIRAEKVGTPVFFPDTVEVITSTSALTDTDTYGYLLIGEVTVTGNKVVGLDQYVYASQVLVRAKPGDDTALWLWSSR